MARFGRTLAVVAALLLSAGCARRDSGQETGSHVDRPPHPTLGDPVDLSTDSLLMAMRPRLNAWLQRWTGVFPGFSLDSLYRSRPEPYRPAYSRKLTSEDLRRVRFFGERSPDSTRIVEADSYRLIVDGAPELWGEPDSAPALADLNADSLRILVTVGTTGGFEDAFWIDANRFVVTGYGERQFEPWRGGGELWAYDLARGTVTRYSTPDVDKATFDRYVEAAKAALRSRYATPA